MNYPRVIPVLLLKDNGLYKSLNFKNLKYVGDPINAIKIFNDKAVDELIFLDITATNNNTEPNYSMLRSIASECFMPLCYGGGIKSLKQIEKILSLGVEKVCLNSSAFLNPELVKEAAKTFGSSTIVVSIDFKKTIFFGNKVYIKNGTKSTGIDPVRFACEMESLGAGEILINSIDRDGTMLGYDMEQIKLVANSVQIPVIACGGAGSIDHITEVIKKANASAAAAGSFFVFQGRHKAVLITYLSKDDFKKFI
jgi:cyclase